MNYLETAKSLHDEIVENRRYLHRNPEIGFDLPKTSAFVKEKLSEYGYDEVTDLLEHGFYVEVGRENGKTILLRADMDGLPIQEKSGVDFASETEGRSHTCGHDIHTATMLATAKMLKENEDALEGTVRIEFQPAEELLIGSEKMVEAGLLDGVDVALAAHVSPTDDLGLYFNEGLSLASANNYRIKVKGVGAHGAMPYNGIDPVFIGAQIVNALQVIISRELPFDKSATISTGGFSSPGSMNIIPDHVVLEGTVRSFDVDSQAYIKERLPEIVEGIAKTYRAEVEFEFLSDVPPLYNDEELTREMRSYTEEFFDGQYQIGEFSPIHASEDFAFVTHRVPSVYFFTGTAHPEHPRKPVHHPEVFFNEEGMAYTAAAFAEMATKWLAHNK